MVIPASPLPRRLYRVVSPASGLPRRFFRVALSPPKPPFTPGRKVLLELLFDRGDLPALVLDVQPQPAEQAHVDVGDPHQREPAEYEAAPAGHEQPETGHPEHDQR